jgi:hypothetical protein
MPNSAVCWQCGASLAELTPPYLRFDICKACRAELHVCRMCRFYDVTVAKQCREPVAEEVRDKTRANVCDYFSPRVDAYAKPIDLTDTRAHLAALFGDKPAAADQQSPSAAQSNVDDAVVARKALESLFGKK